MEENTIIHGNSQCVEDSWSVKFTWKIANFSKLTVKRLYSDVFDAGKNVKWRLLIIPKGNRDVKSLSIYLDAADSKKLPSGWNRYAMFSLSVIDEVHNNNTIIKETQHTFIKEQNDWGFGSFMPLDTLNDPKKGYLVHDTCTVRAEIWCNKQQDKEELNRIKMADLDTGKSSSFSEFNALFTDIQNILEVKPPAAMSSNKFSLNEIADAEKFFIESLDMDLTCIIRSGKALELKDSLTIMLTTNTLPNNMIDEATKFLNDFDENCEKYEAVQEDLNKAKENEDSVFLHKTKLEQLFSKFVPLMNEAKALDREIDLLEKQFTERKAKRAKIMKSLGDVAAQTTSSKEELVLARQKMDLSMIKKAQGENTINEFKKSWECVKELHTMNQPENAQP